MPEKREPWKRQAKESTMAYEAFLRYVGMGPQRSIAKTARGLSKSKATLMEWSKRWHWQERVRAFDEMVEDKALETTIDKHRNMIERHIAFSHKMQGVLADRLNKVRPSELSAKDVQTWLALAVKIERVCNGLPADGPQQPAQQMTVVQADNVQINQQFGEAMADFMGELLKGAPPQVSKWIDDKIRRRQVALGPGTTSSS